MNSRAKDKCNISVNPQSEFLQNHHLFSVTAMMRYLRSIYPLSVVLLFCLHVRAQTDTTIHLKDAVQLAEQRYHLLKSYQYQADAATKAIDVAKHSRLPTIDVSYQAGY